MLTVDVFKNVTTAAEGEHSRDVPAPAHHYHTAGFRFLYGQIS